MLMNHKDSFHDLITTSDDPMELRELYRDMHQMCQAIDTHFLKVYDAFGGFLNHPSEEEQSRIDQFRKEIAGYQADVKSGASLADASVPIKQAFVRASFANELCAVFTAQYMTYPENNFVNKER
jgi:hypothetical protein